MRRLVLTAGKNSFSYSAVHIQGQQNILEDSLSSLQIERFRRIAHFTGDLNSPLTGNVQLKAAVEFIKFNAIAKSTRAFYSSGVRTFINFVSMVGAGIINSGGLPCPYEDLFMYFVSHCSTN